jgi:predicted nucleotidyltransferase
MINVVVQQMADLIVREFRPLRILLFGSHARGQDNPDSDVDFLVVLPDQCDKRKSAIEIRRSLDDFPTPKDILVTTPEEIRRRGHVLGTVLWPALREGITLYERS